ncbi:MAG: vitamin K epoxide reductase family protein [Acidobacteria bacterium]|nr:vitamin K epoxide reductase family protein [Acidobacteriota bacterium]
MTDDVEIDDDVKMPRIPIAASLVALVGLADSVYLTASHYTAEPVPCSLIEGCEKVLNSEFAVIGDVPIAALGALAYFAAFSLALLTAFHYPRTWQLFGLLTAAMAAASLWLIYLQVFVIGAICQFCMISALSSITLFVLFAVSYFLSRGKKPVSAESDETAVAN